MGLTLGGVLVAGELLFRAAVPAPWYVRMYEDSLMIAHVERGYTLRPDRHQVWKNENFDIDVRINRDGLRDSTPALPTAADLRVLAVGDSFTFGLGVEAEESWPEVLEQSLARRSVEGSASVLNAGVPGYSARQIRQMTENLVPRYRPQVVIFGMYVTSYSRVSDPYVLRGAHLVRSTGLRSTELMADGDLIGTGFDEGVVRRIDVWMKHRFHLGAHLLDLEERLRASLAQRDPSPSVASIDLAALREDFVPTLREIEEAGRLARAGGAVLVVLAIDHQEADGAFGQAQQAGNGILREECETRGIRFVDPLPSMIAQAQGRPIFRFPGDPHWNPAAHRVAAEQVDRYLNDEVLPVLGGGTDLAGYGPPVTADRIKN